MRADNNLIAAAAINLDGDLVAVFQSRCIQRPDDLDTFAFENCLDVFGNIFVFMMGGPLSTTVTSLPKRRTSEQTQPT